ncbi:MAG: 8-amino-7-oxononanoate synthase [Propionibacteriaceae bacterium]|nr:8-amino-7-oxononanoate synthase [Propionibacteriaceae bacterium]
MCSPSQARRRQLRTWRPSPDGTRLLPANSAPEGDEKQHSLVDLASNDYLNLAQHPELIAAAKEEINRSGVGAGGSRLISGSRPVHDQLETQLASWLEQDRVLLYPSGFQANIAAVFALADRHVPVLADRLCHYSLLTGVQASGARLQRFSHNDLQDLNRKLERCHQLHPGHKPLVITESLFSMEGTSPDLATMAELCASHGARLLVDEAHALGVLGAGGRGLCQALPSNAVTLLSGTFGKAFGSGGAFLACGAELGETLLQSSGAFRYTTALAPPLAAAALTALTLMQRHPHWSGELITKSQHWRSALASAGWARPGGTGPILPLVIGTDQAALDRQQQLENAGLLSVAIRPPTVPEGTARLRLVVRRIMPDRTLEQLLSALPIS